MSVNKSPERSPKNAPVTMSRWQSFFRDKRKVTISTAAICLLLVGIIIMIMILGGAAPAEDSSSSDTAVDRKYETVSNGDFRYTDHEEEDNNLFTYPMKVDKWTSEVIVDNAWENGEETSDPDNQGGQNSRYGIINTNSEVFDTLTANDIGYIAGTPSNNPEKPKTQGTDNENNFSFDRAKNKHDNILMLYAGDKNVNPDGTKSGINYKSSTFPVSAGEYAEISIWVKTKDVENLDNAHIKIQTSEADELFFANIVTEGITAPDTVKNNGWVLYRFFVSTNLTYGQNITIHLSLGYEPSGTTNNYASGYAFFSDITLRYINQKEYNDMVDLIDAEDSISEFAKYHTFRTQTGAKELDYKNNKFKNNTASDIVTFPSYSDTLEAGKLNGMPAPHARPTTVGGTVDKTGIVALNEADPAYDSEYEEYFKDHPFYNIDNALMIFNANYSSFGYSFVPDPGETTTYLSIGINRYYKVSVWVKTDEMVSGRGASIYLMNEKYEDNRDRYPSAYFEGIDTTKVSTKGKEYNAGWVEYSFYIQGSGAEAQTFYLELWLGKRGAPGAAASDADRAKGYAFFANVTVSAITMYEYQNVSSGTTSKTLAINMKTASTSITNGGFDTPVNSDLITYPLKPSGWTYFHSGDSGLKNMADAERYINANAEKEKNEDGSDNTEYNPLPISRGDNVSGIINVNDLSFDGNLSQAIIGAGAMGPNVLMIHNTVPTAFGYRSSNITLEAKSYYRISIRVKTFGITGGGVNIYLSGLDFDEETVDEDGNTLRRKDEIHAQYNNIVDTENLDPNDNYYGPNVFEMSGASTLPTGWTEYTFLVVTGEYSKTVNLELWLGGREYNEANRTEGYAFFDQARIDKYSVDKDNDVDEFGDILKKLDMALLPEGEEYEYDDYNGVFANLQISDYSSEEVEEEPWEDPGDEEDEPADFDWMIIPSIILAVVLLMAIASVLVRKVTKNIRPRGKIKPSSDYKRKPVRVKDYSDDIDDDDDIEYTNAADEDEFEEKAVKEPKAKKQPKEKVREEAHENQKSDEDDEI